MDPIASNEPALSEAVEKIDHAVETAGENGRLDAGQLVMMGFSQGACLTIEYALRHPGRCRSLIVLTGALIGPPGTEWRGSPTMLAGTRILLTGSDADDWIPEDRARETARVLEGFGAAVDLRLYPGRPHEVSAAELHAAAGFIKNQA
jgi:phospholipase/carboxylesterase